MRCEPQCGRCHDFVNIPDGVLRLAGHQGETVRHMPRANSFQCALTAPTEPIDNIFVSWGSIRNDTNSCSLAHAECFTSSTCCDPVDLWPFKWALHGNATSL